MNMTFRIWLMSKIIFLIMFCGLSLLSHAQKVSNIRAEQRGQDIVVLYTLETTLPCEVSLLLSQDNGSTWGSPLKNVSGDVGKNISAGEKQITWKVLEEREQLIGDNVKFKVIANGKKSIEPEMVFIEGGTFKMGSEAGYSDEKPVHMVNLSSFRMAKFEVTQVQWKAVMGSNPSSFSGCDNCPVESVSWNDVQQYLQKLNAQTGKSYRLPTEAEWEYAAKGGKASQGYTYSGSNNVEIVAWYYNNSSNSTHEVGTKQPNELGIYDMTGNVSEWCSDWCDNYTSYSVTNPTGASTGYDRALRGGCWNDSANLNRMTFRGRCGPGIYGFKSGFRLVLPIE
jgi:formylglycine-generating enzyme required for sulfatase activity